MKQILFALVMIVAILNSVGCGKSDKGDTGSNETVDFDTVVPEELSQPSVEYNIDEILENQKIIFLVVSNNFENQSFKGYFIDGSGEKHLFVLQRDDWYQPVEGDFAYLLEHYDEFEGTDFVDEDTLRRWIDYLYRVDENSIIKAEGEDVVDLAEVTLYGIRTIDGKEEFVWLGSYSGVSRRLDDENVDKLFEELGEDWNWVD